MKMIKILKIIKNLKKIADVKDEEYTNKIKKKNIKTMKNRESIIFFIFQKKQFFTEAIMSDIKERFKSAQI